MPADGCVLRLAGFRSNIRSFASSLISYTYPETKAVISWEYHYIDSTKTHTYAYFGLIVHVFYLN